MCHIRRSSSSFLLFAFLPGFLSLTIGIIVLPAVVNHVEEIRPVPPRARGYNRPHHSCAPRLWPHPASFDGGHQRQPHSAIFPEGTYEHDEPPHGWTVSILTTNWQTNVKDLAIPPKLASSDFLQDISKVSGTDYVGQPSTASTLELADRYTTHLLTTCAHYADGTISCSKPRIGFFMNPAHDLHFDSTAFQGAYPDPFLRSMSHYSKLSRSLAGAYITSAFFLFLANIASCFSAISAAVATALAAVILLGASIANVVVFTSVNTAFNTHFHTAGLASTSGTIPIVLSFVAFAQAFVATIFHVLRSRADTGPRRRRSTKPRGMGSVMGMMGGGGGHSDKQPVSANSSLLNGSGDPAVGVGAGAGPGADHIYGPPGIDASKPPQKPSLLNRIPLLGKHKYMQIERQPSAAGGGGGGGAQRRALDPAGNEASRLSEDWGAADEFSHGPGAAPAAGGAVGGPAISMRSLGGNKPTRDLETAYEPYTSKTTGLANVPQQGGS